MKNRDGMMRMMAVLAVLAIALAVVFFVARQKGPGDTEMTGTQEQSGSTVTSGSFSLDYDKTSNPQGIFRVGRPIQIRLLADTAGARITDYDAYVQFNQNKLNVTDSSSLVSDYSVVRSLGDSIVAVSGYKSVKGAAQSFSGAPLAVLSFTTAEPGTYTFTILPRTAAATTKYLDSEGIQHTPAVGTLSIEVIR